MKRNLASGEACPLIATIAINAISGKSEFCSRSWDGREMELGTANSSFSTFAALNCNIWLECPKANKILVYCFHKIKLHESAERRCRKLEPQFGSRKQTAPGHDRVDRVRPWYSATGEAVTAAAIKHGQLAVLPVITAVPIFSIDDGWSYKEMKGG